jgi:hypothetical protein
VRCIRTGTTRTPRQVRRAGRAAARVTTAAAQVARSSGRRSRTKKNLNQHHHQHQAQTVSTPVVIRRWTLSQQSYAYPYSPSSSNSNHPRHRQHQHHQHDPLRHARRWTRVDTSSVYFAVPTLLVCCARMGPLLTAKAAQDIKWYNKHASMGREGGCMGEIPPRCALE